IFVFYDDVQYDDRGWRNRNRVKTPRGSQWITIPVFSKGCQTNHTPICDIKVNYERNWPDAHFKAFQHNYAAAPFFKRYAPMLTRWYTAKPERLADFTIETTIELARELGIAHTQFVRSSTLNCSGTKTDRLLEVLRKVGASHYISGPSAKEYVEEEKFAAAGIGLEWMVYDYPEYPQLHPPYDPHVSVLDLLLMTGSDAPGYIWKTPAPEAVSK